MGLAEFASAESSLTETLLISPVLGRSDAATQPVWWSSLTIDTQLASAFRPRIVRQVPETSPPIVSYCVPGPRLILVVSLTHALMMTGSFIRVGSGPGVGCPVGMSVGVVVDARNERDEKR